MNSAISNQQSAISKQQATISEQLPAVASPRFDFCFSLVSFWFVAGLFLDGWAHNHGQVDQSFFTPWHAVLYAGQFAVFLLLLAALARGRAQGRTWGEALPPGYALSLLGAILWIPAGIGDLIWHTLFGIEKGFEALLSPTHIALGFAGFLMVTGPLRAAWRQKDADNFRTLRSQLPMLLSLTFVLSSLTFFTQDANPIGSFAGTTRPATAPTLVTEFGISGMLFTAALLMGVVLPVVARWRLAPGALTLVFSINAFLMGFQNDEYPLLHVLALALAGLVADGLLLTLRPSAARRGALRLFAFLVPAIMYALYFAAAQLTGGLWWSVHVWTGVIVLSGIVGVLLSLLVAPPSDQAVMRA